VIYNKPAQTPNDANSPLGPKSGGFKLLIIEDEVAEGFRIFG
jgi:hypothetical protein